MSFGNTNPEGFNPSRLLTELRAERTNAPSSALGRAPGRFMVGRLVTQHPNLSTDVLSDSIQSVDILTPENELWAFPYIGHNIVLDKIARAFFPDEHTTARLLAVEDPILRAMSEKTTIRLDSLKYDVTNSYAAKKHWLHPSRPLHSGLVSAVLDPVDAAAIYQEYRAMRTAAGIKTSKQNKGNAPRMSRVPVLQVVGEESVLNRDATRRKLLCIAAPALGRYTLSPVRRYKMPQNG